MNRASKVVLTIWKIIAVLCMILFILTFSAPFIISGVVISAASFIISLSVKADPNKAVNRLKGVSAALCVMLFICFSIPPITIYSPIIWQYPIQRTYVGLYHNIKEPQEFPDFRTDVQGDYQFEYMPGIMQGSGHYSVTFRTSPERAAEYAAEFAPKVKYTISLDDYLQNEGKYSVEDPDYENARDGTLNVYVSEGMKNGSSGKAQIFVLSAVLNFNHPHSTAVIADTETGMIQLSQLG